MELEKYLSVKEKQAGDCKKKRASERASATQARQA